MFAKRRKKRPYLLLELLIAFALLTACLLPLTQNPLTMVGKEREMLQELELAREADLLFADVKQRLYTNKIPYEKLIPWDDKKLTPLKLELGKNYTKEFKREIRLRSQVEKIKKDKMGEEIRLINVHIVFISRSKKDKQKTVKFGYKVFIQCTPPNAVA